MNPTQLWTLLAARTKAARGAAARPRPACETLEGRQLMNAAWGHPGMWHGPATGPVHHVPAHVRSFGLGGHHAPGIGGAHRGQVGQMLSQTGQWGQVDTHSSRGEVPGERTAERNHERGVMEQNFASQALPGFSKGAAFGRPGRGPAAIASRLRAANVPLAQADPLAAEMQTGETTLKTFDPAQPAGIGGGGHQNQQSGQFGSGSVG